MRNIIENGVPKTAMVALKKQLNETEIQDVLAEMCWHCRSGAGRKREHPRISGEGKHWLIE